MNTLDLTGQRFGRLVALRFAGVEKNKRLWCARCDCGRDAVVKGESLRSGNTTSCGCKKVERAAGLKLRHGHARHTAQSPEYRTWKGMLNRCNCPTSSAYPKYGGRGVTVCQRWQGAYEAFLEDMGPKPTPGHSIDRIDPFGNYEPANCRWATGREQALNKRSHKKEQHT